METLPGFFFLDDDRDAGIEVLEKVARPLA